MKMLRSVGIVALLLASCLPAFSQARVVDACSGLGATIYPTGSNGAALIIDKTGVLCTNATGGSGSSAITTWAGGTLGAMAAYGTSPGGVLVPGMNSYITNIPHVIVDSAAGVGEGSAITTFSPIGTRAGGATGGTNHSAISCDSHIFKHITTATDTLAVQGVASQAIYVCGWRSRAAGTATWFLENTASVNANCSSTLTQITGVATEAINTGEIVLPALWTGLKNTAGNGLCINSTGTGGVDVDIWYAQF